MRVRRSSIAIVVAIALGDGHATTSAHAFDGTTSVDNSSITCRSGRFTNATLWSVVGPFKLSERQSQVALVGDTYFYRTISAVIGFVGAQMGAGALHIAHPIVVAGKEFCASGDADRIRVALNHAEQSILLTTNERTATQSVGLEPGKHPPGGWSRIVGSNP